MVSHTNAKCGGKRAPEIAAGDLTKALEHMSANMTAEVLKDIVHLTCDEKSQLLSDLELGQAFVMMCLSLEHQHYKENPWVLLGLAHYDVARARLAAQQALVLYDQGPPDDTLQHRITRKWLSPDGRLRAQVQHFADGGPMGSEMQYEVDCLVFVPCVERIQEGEHSRVHRATALRRVSGAYVACVQRQTDLAEAMSNESERVALCQAFTDLKTVHDIAHRFHFQDHPLWQRALAASAYGGRVSKRKVATQIMYGMDPLTAHASMSAVRKKHAKRAARQLRKKSVWQNFFFPGEDIEPGSVDQVLMYSHLQTSLKPGFVYSMPKRLLQARWLEQSVVQQDWS